MSSKGLKSTQNQKLVTNKLLRFLSQAPGIFEIWYNFNNKTVNQSTPPAEPVVRMTAALLTSELKIFQHIFKSPDRKDKYALKLKN